jgi:hypothetical protein
MEKRTFLGTFEVMPTCLVLLLGWLPLFCNVNRLICHLLMSHLLIYFF